MELLQVYIVPPECVRGDEEEARRRSTKKKVARSLRRRRELILDYFRSQKLLSSGVVEGLNNKATESTDDFFDTEKEKAGFPPEEASRPKTKPLNLRGVHRSHCQK
jgi:hypothetical protein